jgi:Tfp pilus assembly protein PilO
LLLIVLLCIDAVALGVLLSPIGGATRMGHQAAARQEMSALWKDLQSRTQEIMPGRNIEQKIAETKQQISSFSSVRLPSRYSSIAERLGKVAGASGVRITATRYLTDATEDPGLQRVQIETTVTGSYTDTIRFINGLERDQMFFLIDQVSLGEAQGGMVHLNIRLETYLKSA